MKNTTIQVYLCSIIISTMFSYSIQAQEKTTIIQNEKNVIISSNYDNENSQGSKKNIIVSSDTGKRNSKKIKGSDKITSEKRKVEGSFDKISSETHLNVFVEQADSYEINVEAEDNIIPYIITEIKNGELKIYLDNISVSLKKDANVYVKLPKISELKTSSSSNIKITKPIKSDKLKLKANVSGKIILDKVTARSVDIEANSSSVVRIESLEAKELDIEASSAGEVKVEYTKTPKIEISSESSADVTIKGETTDLDISVSSAASVYAKDLISENVKVSASSTGSASVFPKASLEAEASSLGNIYYYNKAKKIETEKSSSGSIKQK